MFRLRQRTRRQFCRAGFLIGCLVPTLALALWGAYRHTPLHDRQLEMALEQSLGLQVRVYGVTHPRPGLVCYEGLELSDAETGAPIATCDAASMRTPARSGATELSIHGLSIERGGLPACYALLERVLHSGRDAAKAQFAAQRRAGFVRRERHCGIPIAGDRVDSHQQLRE